MKYVLSEQGYGKPVGTVGFIEDHVGDRVWFRTSDSHRMLVPFSILKVLEK